MQHTNTQANYRFNWSLNSGEDRGDDIRRWTEEIDEHSDGVLLKRTSVVSILTIIPSHLYSLPLSL